MARPARLAVLSALALALLGASAFHLLWRPAVHVTPGRTVITLEQGPAVAGDVTERQVLGDVLAAGLKVVDAGRVDEPISRSPFVITTTSGVLVVAESLVVCTDAAGVARDLRLIGSGDSMALDELHVGRLHGAIVFSPDTRVWSAIDAAPC